MKLLRQIAIQFGVTFVALALLFTLGAPALQRFEGHQAIQKVIYTLGFAGEAYAITPDYEVDGNADDVQVQQALNALPVTGGKLVLYAGNWHFNATVSRAINNVTIEGDGKGTYIVNNAATALFSVGAQTGWIFKDFRTDAGYLTLTTDTIIENVWNGTQRVGMPGRTATYVLATSDATQSVKAAADDILTGTSDEDKINAALTSYGNVNVVGRSVYITDNISMSANYETLILDPDSTIYVADASNVGVVLDASHLTFTFGTIRPVTVPGVSPYQGAPDYGIIYQDLNFSTITGVIVHGFDVADIWFDAASKTPGTISGNNWWRLTEGLTAGNYGLKQDGVAGKEEQGSNFDLGCVWGATVAGVSIGTAGVDAVQYNYYNMEVDGGTITPLLWDIADDNNFIVAPSLTSYNGTYAVVFEAGTAGNTMVANGSSNLPLAGDIPLIDDNGNNVVTGIAQYNKRIPAAAAYLNTADQTVNAGQVNTIIFNTEQFDNLSEYNNTTGNYTSTQEGTYLITFRGNVTWGAGAGTVGLLVYKGSTQIGGETLQAAGTAVNRISGSLIARLAIGDVISIRVWNSTANTVTVNYAVQNTGFEIHKIS